MPCIDVTLRANKAITPIYDMECEEDNAKVQKAYNNNITYNSHIDGRRTGIWMALRALFAALFFLSGANAIAQPVKIMVFGDSLVAGFGLPPGAAFPDILAQNLIQQGYQNEMINAGVSGDTTAGGVTRIDWALADRPDAVVLVLGGNDMLRGLRPAASEQNLRIILSRLADEGVPVLLCGMLAPENLGADYAAEFNPLYPGLAAEFTTFFMPFFLQDVALVPALNQPDGLHPNSSGIDVIIQNLMPELLALLASVGEKKG